MLVGSILSQGQAHRIARNVYAASVRMGELLDEFVDQTRNVKRETEVSDVHELVTGAVDKVAVAALQLCASCASCRQG